MSQAIGFCYLSSNVAYTEDHTSRCEDEARSMQRIGRLLLGDLTPEIYLRDGGVQEVSGLKSRSLEVADEPAHSVHNWAIGLGVAEGGAERSYPVCPGWPPIAQPSSLLL